MSCGVMKAPCKSCPYRQDVPSGVWHEEEYDKLPAYDGEIIEQLQAGATQLFMCHQRDGNLCAGWLATHGSDNLIALRLTREVLDAQVWGYESPVPVWSSGKEAAEHGKREIKEPSAKASRTIDRLLDKHPDLLTR